MTRAGDNPYGWNILLLALERDDIQTAQKIAIKYGFGTDQLISRYNYYCKLPSGTLVTFGTMKQLADFLEMTPRAVGSRFNIGNLTWEIGKRKGYEIWRKLKWEDN